MDKSANLIWIDLEMTGLNTMTDHIIEIATVVTDADLNVLAEGPVIAIHQTEERLSEMDEWNTRQHSRSGLVERVLMSTYTVQRAERETLDFLANYSEPFASPMCGNSICQDRRFMAREMPDLEVFFHYRNLDVSTLKELAKRWAPKVVSGMTKKANHLAMDDVYDSIAELRHYREHFLRCQTP